MDTLWLRLQAPFAAFRWLQAGVHRATSPVIPPSAAWGLALNLAGVETRDPTPAAVTRIRADAPPLRIAVGQLGQAGVATLFQQLHTYPVGNSGKERAAGMHGAKYWIAPAKREVLVGLDCVLGVQSGDRGLLGRMRDGLDGRLGSLRYGLPFAGDNNLLFDRIDVVESPPPAFWYERVDRALGARPGSCRLTIAIDRADASRTRSALMAPTLEAMGEPPPAAWNWTPAEP